ncbi:unnamed protein product [Adineta ricciae]|uniref:Uncharacterized protein n=1 Tax=Adineta ricciae TaxID=249248 RepID=A0A815PXW1_ADIRI|nr:unnamed protein product [Adineta ricciae]
MMNLRAIYARISSSYWRQRILFLVLLASSTLLCFLLLSSTLHYSQTCLYQAHLIYNRLEFDGIDTIEHFAEFICPQNVRHLVDWIYGWPDGVFEEKIGVPTNAIHVAPCLPSGSIIIVKTYYLSSFFRRVYPQLLNKFVLKTTQVDASAPLEFLSYFHESNSRIIHWFVQNSDVHLPNNDRFTSIPIVIRTILRQNTISAVFLHNAPGEQSRTNLRSFGMKHTLPIGSIQTKSTHIQARLTKQTKLSSSVMEAPARLVKQNIAAQASSLTRLMKSQHTVSNNFKAVHVKRLSKKTIYNHNSSQQPVTTLATSNVNIENISPEPMYTSSLDSDYDHHVPAARSNESSFVMLQSNKSNKDDKFSQCSPSKVKKNILDINSLAHNAFTSHRPRMTFDITTDRIIRNDHKNRKMCAARFPLWCVVLSCMCFVFLAVVIAAIIALAIVLTKTKSTTSTTLSTVSMTTTTPTAYCASTCTGSFNSSASITCGLYCDDGGGYYCRPSSTYCAGKYFSPTGFGYCDPASSQYTGPCNTTDHCCVYDNYIPDYYCLSRSSCGFTG